MNGQGKLLTHFLKNADKLVIPVYQRNYDWKEEHCKKLYFDLVKTVSEGKRWHFFGGIDRIKVHEAVMTICKTSPPVPSVLPPCVTIRTPLTSP